MNIDETFRKLNQRQEGALIAFITGGDPTPRHTLKIVKALVQGGADIIEIGVPFSDPIADGPTIQASDNRALNAGTTPRNILEIVKESKKHVDVPIALLTYYNILFKRGISCFLEEAHQSRVDGLIIPDLPIEEAHEYKTTAEDQGIDTIFLATPATTVARLKDIIEYTSGFLYLVSVFGVTGTREKLAELTIQTIKKVKPYTSGTVPLAVGFGISTTEHVKSVMDCGVEGAIVGSAFVKTIEDTLTNEKEMIDRITTLTKKLKTATLPQ